jgi:hypothetical protein|tara:strand:- start:7092 stop:7385 length:294 start_codon:yes stop_codon:yes gene_type:complete
MKDNENSLESLDKKTCDQVTHDMQICMDDWSKKDLDTRAAIITLTRFCVELSFKFSHTPYDAMQLLSTVVMDNLESYEHEELIQLLTQSRDQKVTIH